MLHFCLSPVYCLFNHVPWSEVHTLCFIVKIDPSFYTAPASDILTGPICSVLDVENRLSVNSAWNRSESLLWDAPEERCGTSREIPALLWVAAISSSSHVTVGTQRSPARWNLWGELKKLSLKL